MRLSEGEVTLEIDGDLLRDARRMAGYRSAEAFAEAANLSTNTIYRAEQSGRLSHQSAMAIACALERENLNEFLTNQPEEDRAEFDLTGDWHGFFVEDDRFREPYLVEENVSLSIGEDKQLVGESHCVLPHDERKEIYKDLKLAGNSLFGRTEVVDWVPPAGFSVFCLVASGAWDWLEGFVTWYDSEAPKSEVSRMILVRKSSVRYTMLIEDARALMKEEVGFFRLRKYLETERSLAKAMRVMELWLQPD